MIKVISCTIETVIDLICLRQRQAIAPITKPFAIEPARYKIKYGKTRAQSPKS